ncbi:MAG: hypothetical protein WCW02_01875, partial [Candidatus Buchananbacteria bacterium]
MPLLKKSSLVLILAASLIVGVFAFGFTNPVYADSEINTLTITKLGTGTGTVTSDPAGISCGLDCFEAYASSTVVVLTAVP